MKTKPSNIHFKEEPQGSLSNNVNKLRLQVLEIANILAEHNALTKTIIVPAIHDLNKRLQVLEQASRKSDSYLEDDMFEKHPDK